MQARLPRPRRRPLPVARRLSAVVQHLQVLEASGLVRSEKTGRVRTCRIEPAALGAVETWGRRAASLATAEFKADGDGTRLIFTERGA